MACWLVSCDIQVGRSGTTSPGKSAVGAFTLNLGPHPLCLLWTGFSCPGGPGACVPADNSFFLLGWIRGLPPSRFLISPKNWLALPVFTSCSWRQMLGPAPSSKATVIQISASVLCLFLSTITCHSAHGQLHQEKQGEARQHGEPALSQNPLGAPRSLKMPPAGFGSLFGSLSIDRGNPPLFSGPSSCSCFLPST